MSNIEIRFSYNETVTRFEILEISKYVRSEYVRQPHSHSSVNKLTVYLKLDLKNLYDAATHTVSTLFIAEAAISNTMLMLKKIYDAYKLTKEPALFCYEKSKLTLEKSLILEAFPRSLGNDLISYVMLDYSEYANFPHKKDMISPVFFPVEKIPEFINAVNKQVSDMVL